MKNRLKVLILVVLAIMVFVGCTSQPKQEKKGLEVAVAIPPLKTFVDKVSGNTVGVVTVIPPGNSPANYQPSPKQMVKISNADVYFTLNMPTEKVNILGKIGELNNKARVVDLQELVFNMYPSRRIEEHEHEGEEEHSEEEEVEIDPHIWLSPKRAIVIVEGIRDTLVLLDAENADTYKKNAQDYIKEIEDLDKEIKKSLAPNQDKTFIIFHPTYGYYADDYGLNQMAIESDGKEATAKGLENLVKHAKENDIKAVFYQAEFDSNQAEIIAKEIKGQTVRVAPLSTNYIDSLKEVTEKLVNIMK